MTITMSSAHSPTFPSLHYDTTHSPTLRSLHLRHSSFSNPSVALPTSQFILQPFFTFTYVTSSSLNSPGDPPMLSQYYGNIKHGKISFHHDRCIAFLLASNSPLNKLLSSVQRCGSCFTLILINSFTPRPINIYCAHLKSKVNVMKVTLRYHDQLSMSVYRGTDATSTNPVLILPVLNWTLG